MRWFKLAGKGGGVFEPYDPKVLLQKDEGFESCDPKFFLIERGRTSSPTIPKCCCRRGGFKPFDPQVFLIEKGGLQSLRSRSDVAEGGGLRIP